MVEITSTTISKCTAAAVGGGLAVRATRLVKAPGARFVELTNVTVAANKAKRGGGLYSEVETGVTGSRFSDNVADENGGGASFQPSPCRGAFVRINASSFEQNTGSSLLWRWRRTVDPHSISSRSSHDISPPTPTHSAATASGGGVYALSVNLTIGQASFERNEALFGAGLYTDCVPEICVGDLPRDACHTQATTVSDAAFRNNTALSLGGAVLVANQVLSLGGPAMAMAGNSAGVGAAVYVDKTAEVAVGPGLQTALNVSNTALQYGDGIASEPALVAWAVAPVTTPPVQAGGNLCAMEGGCRVTLYDLFDNVPTIPTVVEVVNLSPEASEVDGARYVLVADGISDAIPDLSISLVTSDPLGLPPSVETTLGIDFAGASNAVGSVALPVVSTPCEAGHGASYDGTAVRCQACAPGSFSDRVSWEACAVCPAGEATGETETAATECANCAPGYGWQGGGCVACEVGTFSPNVTASGVGCLACDDGLTTDGEGANGCAIAIAGDGGGQAVDGVLVVITICLALLAVVALIASCVTHRNARHGAIGTVVLSVRNWRWRVPNGRMWCLVCCCERVCVCVCLFACV